MRLFSYCAGLMIVGASTVCAFPVAAVEAAVGRCGAQFVAAGEIAVANAESVGRSAVTPPPGATVLHVTLTPDAVVPGEAFLVRIAAAPPDGAAVPLGDVSFFPPPHRGQARTFILSLPPDLRESQRLVVEISLVPLPPDSTLTGSAVRLSVVRAE